MRRSAERAVLALAVRETGGEQAGELGRDGPV